VASRKYDDAIEQYKKTGKITADMKPLKSNGQKYGRNSDAVLKVLADTWSIKSKVRKLELFR
jgi:hypothetical protein